MVWKGHSAHLSLVLPSDMLQLRVSQNNLLRVMFLLKVIQLNDARGNPQRLDPVGLTKHVAFTYEQVIFLTLVVFVGTTSKMWLSIVGWVHVSMCII